MYAVHGALIGTLLGLNSPIIGGKNVFGALTHLSWASDGRTDGQTDGACWIFKKVFVFVVVVVEKVSWTSRMEEPQKEAAKEEQPHPLSSSPADPGNPAPADPENLAPVELANTAPDDPGKAAPVDRPQDEGEWTVTGDEDPLELPSAGPANFLPHFKHRKFFVLRVNTLAGFSPEMCVISVLTHTRYTHIVTLSLNICHCIFHLFSIVHTYIILCCTVLYYSILHYNLKDNIKFY